MPENETLFFSTLSKIVGARNLTANAVGMKVSSNDIYLDKDYKQYGFQDNINSLFQRLLVEFQSVGSIGTGSLSHHIGGRIAQRAYYDTLRYVAHYSPRNDSFSPPLRFTIFELEEEAGCEFNKIPLNELESLLESRLNLLD